MLISISNYSVCAERPCKYALHIRKFISTTYQHFDLEVVGSSDEFIGFSFNQLLSVFSLCLDKKVSFCSKIKYNMDAMKLH